MVLGLSFDHPDVIPVTHDLYVKTPEALQLLLDALKEIGYTVQNNRENGYAMLGRRISVEKMERDGLSLWYARLPNINFAKCKSCKSRISTAGTLKHGHKCEVCGEVLYYGLIDGSIVRFEFLTDEERGFLPPHVAMTVKRWDGEYLYLYLTPTEWRQFGTLDDEGTREYFAKHQDKWESVTENGVDLIRLRYASDGFTRGDPDTVIEMIDSAGRYYNYTNIKVWEDKEYSEYDRNFPVPESMSIFETWHWAPLPASPRLHERILLAVHQTSDKGWHYQDNSPWFRPEQWQEMARFVRHFTELDAEAFDRAWPRFRRSGPGGIDDLARFCHPNAQVEDRPNIWNSVTAVSKALSGQTLTDSEIEAARKGLGDPANPFRS